MNANQDRCSPRVDTVFPFFLPFGITTYPCVILNVNLSSKMSVSKGELISKFNSLLIPARQTFQYHQYKSASHCASHYMETIRKYFWFTYFLFSSAGQFFHNSLVWYIEPMHPGNPLHSYPFSISFSFSLVGHLLIFMSAYIGMTSIQNPLICCRSTTA